MTILIKNVKKANGRYGKLFVKLRTPAQKEEYYSYDGSGNLSICCCVTFFIFTLIIILGSICYYNERHHREVSLIYPPPNLSDVPSWWYSRGEDLRKLLVDGMTQNQHVHKLTHNRQPVSGDDEPPVIQDSDVKKLVCYYAMPDPLKKFESLQLRNIDANLCTHINVGIVPIVDNTLAITPEMVALFNETKELKVKNKDLKFLIWTGGIDYAKNFANMVKNHANRKSFIRSLKFALREYEFDGIDLDWEFPSAFNKERQHFSQLLQEIRREYQREKRDYLLTVAVAAVEGIAYYAYDVKEINKYADFANIMTYDYHFWSRGTPFTGLNAPLYPRKHEHSILGTLNLNYSLNFWHESGLDKNKIVVGLPTYGHSFKLVNPFNHEIGAPSSGYGSVGKLGFASFSEVCWFKQNNIYVTIVYDPDTCSPYLHSVNEWISFENQQSLACKTKYIRDQGFGGAMLFSLNTDDFGMLCSSNTIEYENDVPETFPLIRKVKSILFK